ALPSERADLAFQYPRIDAFFGVRLEDAKIHGVAERVLAVRCHVVTLLTHHLVELRASVTADELEPCTRVTPSERAKQLEQTRIEFMPLTGNAVGQEIGEAIGRRRALIEWDTLDRMRLNQRTEQCGRLGLISPRRRTFPIREPLRTRHRRIYFRRRGH